MINGAFHGGNRGPAFSGALRPAPGWASHRMPIPGLYQTGGSTHPGGSITGAPGRNAAMVLLADLGHDPAEVMSGPAVTTAREAGPVPDEQVMSAIANWGPRFTAQGVDPGDFARVTAGIERWADWLGAWRDNGDLHAGLAREAAGAWLAADRRRGLDPGRRQLPLRQVRLDAGHGRP